MTDLVIFDLDGTLLDTIGDLAAACNAALALRGLPQHDRAGYCSLVGNGVRKLVERALPEALRTPRTVESALQDFLAYYSAHIDIHTEPYAGIPELLDVLRGRGIRLAVASNKCHEGVVRLIGRFFPDTPFEAVFGQRPGVPLKPDPAVVREIVAGCGVRPDRTLFVGDSGVDMQTATAAGVRPVGVAWGFRSREELVESGAWRLIDSPEGLEALL